LIGREQKFVRLAFILEANGLQNAYMAVFFGSFAAKSLFGGGKLVYSIYGNPNPPRVDFLNLYKVYNLYILMDFYLVLSRRVCPRSS
jgi:hypothetical protein